MSACRQKHESLECFPERFFSNFFHRGEIYPHQYCIFFDLMQVLCHLECNEGFIVQDILNERAFEWDLPYSSIKTKKRTTCGSFFTTIYLLMVGSAEVYYSDQKEVLLELHLNLIQEALVT